MKTVALVPARIGSERVPRKALTHVHYLPMMQWTCMAARDAQRIDETYVCTNDPSIIEVAKRSGVNVIKTSDELDDGKGGIERVVKHALAGEANGADVIVLLNPTSPLRGPKRIDEAVQLATTSLHESCVSVVNDPGAMFLWTANGTRGWTRERTQNIRIAREAGGTFVTTRKKWEGTHDIVGMNASLLWLDEWEGTDVDTYDDLKVANWWMAAQVQRNPVNSWFARTWLKEHK